MTSTTTPHVSQGAVSFTISGDCNVNHPHDDRQVLSNQRSFSKHTNANRYLRTGVAYLKGTAA